MKGSDKEGSNEGTQIGISAVRDPICFPAVEMRNCLFLKL